MELPVLVTDLCAEGVSVAVYVDDAQLPFGRMVMCHMLADTTAELLAMADAIGLNRKWIQKVGTAREHFDVSKQYRQRAIAAGAVEVDSRRLVEIIQARRA